MDFFNSWIILLKEIRDSKRNKWFVVVSVLFSFLAVSLSLLGLSGLGNFGVAGFGRTAASLLNLVLLIVPLMGLLLGAMSVAAEREQGTLLTLLAQPVTLMEVVIGKFLGSAAALILTISIGFGLSGLVIAHFAGLDQIKDYVVLVLFTILLALAFLSIGFCLSILARRQATAIGFALFTWFVFMFLSDLGLMGTALVLKLKAKELFWFVLLSPAQSFKLAVIGSLQKSYEIFGSAGLYAEQIFGNQLIGFLMVVLILWIALPLLIAVWIFRKRAGDL